METALPALEDRRMTGATKRSATDRLLGLDSALPTPDQLITYEKIAFIVAAFMMLMPLAMAAWGAHFGT